MLMMKIGVAAVALLFAACLDNPNSAPELSTTKIDQIKLELRLAKYSSFMKNESDTLPKHIQASDTGTKNIFGREQVNAWAMLANLPKGVQATIQVNATESRAGKITESPGTTIVKLNTCCDDNWNRSSRVQLQVPFWNRPEDLPYKIVYEVRIQGIPKLIDSITIN